MIDIGWPMAANGNHGATLLFLSFLYCLDRLEAIARRNKKLVVTGATVVVTNALLVVTRS